MDPSRLTRLIQETLHPELPENSNYLQACVFLLVFERLGRLFVLAIQKTDTEGYPWRNQVALPGGHVDPNDDTPLDACFRELEEELCITRDQVTLTGSLGHFQTIKNHNIEAFSGFWNDKGRICHKANEISRVLDIPVSDLMKVHIDRQFHGYIPDVFELQYPVQDVTIWGVTARILHHFLEMLYCCRSEIGL
ncbi:MAG: CoA pyrophosphatase [Desulfatirhabdiaceae bacterium]